MNNTAPTYFARQSTNPHNQLRVIEDAYRLFKIEAPTRALDIKNIVEAGAQSVTGTATRLARQAFTDGTDPEAWYADALEQIKEAQAREALAKAFAGSYSQNLQAALPEFLADAAEALAPHVEKVARKLSTAAANLPAGSLALDPEANLTNDSGAALQEARQALQQLALVASIYQQGAPVGNASPALMALIPIVAFPRVEVEVIADSLGEDVSVLNADACAGTYTVRGIGKAARDSLDLTIIDIARGEHGEASISLASATEYRERRAAAARAYQRSSTTTTPSIRVLS